jgi:nitrite reductase (NO-forming)
MYAMLHIDSGILGTYEFPGADVPAKDDAGMMISPSFMMNSTSTMSGATTTTADDKNVAMKAETRTFTVTAGNFSYDLKQIKVSQGETVVINFKNSEGFHDWVIDEFNARTKQIGEGKSETISFVASKKGTFEYYCSVGKHRAMGMKGSLIVQ